MDKNVTVMRITLY